MTVLDGVTWSRLKSLIADHKVAQEAVPRLTRQQRQILNLLKRKRTVSNAELARIAIRYSARIHELRRLGYDIRIVAQDHEKGLTWYRLFDRAAKSVQRGLFD